MSKALFDQILPSHPDATTLLWNQEKSSTRSFPGSLTVWRERPTQIKETQNNQSGDSVRDNTPQLLQTLKHKGEKLLLGLHVL